MSNERKINNKRDSFKESLLHLTTSMLIFFKQLLKQDVTTPNEAKRVLLQQIKHYWNITLSNDTRLATLTKYMLKYYDRDDEFDLILKRKIETWEYGKPISYIERPLSYIKPKLIKNKVISDFFTIFKNEDLPNQYTIYITKCSFILTTRLDPDSKPIIRFQYPIKDKRGVYRFRVLFDNIDDKFLLASVLPNKIINHIDNYTVRKFHGKAFIQYVTLNQTKSILRSLKANKIKYYANQRMDCST